MPQFASDVDMAMVDNDAPFDSIPYDLCHCGLVLVVAEQVVDDRRHRVGPAVNRQ